MINNCIGVALGGCIGAVLRYLIGLIPVKETMQFPIKTFGINVLGCIAIALIVIMMSRTANHAMPEWLGLFLKVGICGGFTTFSTFALESTDLIRNGQAGIAFLYMILSVVVGVAVIMVILLAQSRG